MSTVNGYLNERTRTISQSSRLIKRRTNGISLLIEGQDGSLLLPRESMTTNRVVKSTSRRHCYEKKEVEGIVEMMSIGEELMGTSGRFHHPLYGMFSQEVQTSRMSKTFPGLCPSYGNSLMPLFLIWKLSQAFVLF